MQSLRYVKQKQVPNKVVVHPIVLLSVVDHFNRVAKDTRRRVCGLLLGTFEPDGSVEARTSFAIPFEEDSSDPDVWFLDHNYLDSMFEMFRKVNSSERVIGWYHTGPKLKHNDVMISEIVQRYVTHPVLVIVDVKLNQDPGRQRGLPVSAYYVVEETSDDGSQPTRTFKNMASELGAEETEEVGVEHLLRDIKDTTAGTIGQRIESTAASLKGLEDKLAHIHKYLVKVVDGTMPMNEKITNQLQDIFNLIPNLDLESFTKSFAVTTNNQLAGIYLASLVRSVIALHNLIGNKITNKELEASELKLEMRGVNMNGKDKKTNEGKSATDDTDVSMDGNK